MDITELSQLDRIKAKASAEGFEIVKAFTDDRFSATDRPIFPS
jgi:hypothetical protein